MTGEQTFANVWDAIESEPAEAAIMQVRSTLLMRLNQHLEQLQGTDAEKAARLGVTIPRHADLQRGRIQCFTTDDLIGMAVAAGLHINLDLTT